MKPTTIALAVSSLLASLVFPQAAETVLNFKLVTKTIAVRDGQAQAFGATFAPDGRVGVEEFSFKSADGTGSSTYFWDDGSITADFKLTNDKGAIHGEYTILSGAGVYNGASGSGTIIGHDPTTSGLKDAGLFDITLRLHVPLQNDRHPGRNLGQRPLANE